MEKAATSIQQFWRWLLQALSTQIWQAQNVVMKLPPAMEYIFQHITAAATASILLAIHVQKEKFSVVLFQHISRTN